MELPEGETTGSPKGVYTGEKLSKSDAKYELIRMLLDGMSYVEIVQTLKHLFRIETSESSVAAFKKNFFPLYKDMIEQWDTSRYQYIVARVTEEMKVAAKKAVQEVHEIDRLRDIINERIALIISDDARKSAAYEGVLKDYIKTAAALAQRTSEITGSTGVEEKLKEMVKRTAMAAQKTLYPYVQGDRKDEAFKLFDQELEELLVSVDSGAILSE